MPAARIAADRLAHRYCLDGFDAVDDVDAVTRRVDQRDPTASSGLTRRLDARAGFCGKPRKIVVALGEQPEARTA